jgi:hypothetical protein
MVLVAMAAQMVDLASFGMIARAAGPGGELGPLGDVYADGGFGPVIAAKVLGLLAILCIFALYRLRVGSPRPLALIVAAFGIVGAASNVLGILRLG